jgi:DNA-binding transcriptional regulator PaaX
MYNVAMVNRIKSESSLVYVLKALIPYSRENLNFAFRPNKFYNELEKKSGLKQKTLQQSLRRAEIAGFITREESLIMLSAKGRQELKKFSPQKLPRSSQIIVIFDIPESDAWARRRLRILLRQWRFEMVQKSVWASRYECRKDLAKAIKTLGLKNCVKAYEAKDIALK